MSLAALLYYQLLLLLLLCHLCVLFNLCINPSSLPSEFHCVPFHVSLYVLVISPYFLFGISSRAYHFPCSRCNSIFTPLFLPISSTCFTSFCADVAKYLPSPTLFCRLMLISGSKFRSIEVYQTYCCYLTFNIKNSRSLQILCR